VPKALSYFLTTDQVRRREKTVTRRLKCSLKPGELFWAVEKVQGLKKGEKHNRLALCRCLKNDQVTLNGPTMTPDDCRREGFPEITPQQFVEMFCKHMRCEPDKQVRRVDFEYVGLYSIGTLDVEENAYTPHGDVPAFNLTIAELRQSVRTLRRQYKYECHRVRDADGSHDCNDPNVLIERTDGKSEAAILEGWKR
jgi:hypothetical protein